MVITSIPEEALLEILSMVPAYDLTVLCCRVCTLWRDIIQSQALWKRKSQRDGLVSKHCQRTPPNWKMFYLLHKKKRNLLKNPCGVEGFEYWEIATMMLNQWEVEQLPGDHVQPFPDDKVKNCFFVPNGSKHQLIDLEKQGYPGQWLDVMQPEIVIRDWYSTKPNFTSTYYAYVMLLSKQKDAIQDFVPGVLSDAQWTQIEYRFKKYGPGVRYIHFEHGAGDIGRLKGARVTNSSVTIEPEDLST